VLLRARVSIAALAVLLLTASCSDGDEDEQPRHPTAVFITGTVMSHGKPVAAAEVSIDLRDEHAEATAKVGDTIPMLTAGEATTDDDGDFVIRADPAKVPTNFFVGGRDRSMINYELRVMAPMAWTTWGSTMHWHDGVWRSDNRAVAADKTVVFEVDLGTERQTVTDSFGDAARGEAFVGPVEADSSDR
jgi:hypothetical protein